MLVHNFLPPPLIVLNTQNVLVLVYIFAQILPMGFFIQSSRLEQLVCIHCSVFCHSILYTKLFVINLKAAQPFYFIYF